MRFLIAPRPGNSGGPEIFLKRMSKEIVRRGYQWTATPFKYLGFSLLPWQQAIIMNAPRYNEKLLNSGKPTLAIMGQPTVKEYCLKVGLPYLQAYEEQELKMAEVIKRSSKVVFISRYVRNVWAEVFQRRGLPFPSEKQAIIAFHGVDLRHFHPPADPLKSPFVLGSAGALRSRFRLSTLFRVSRLLEFDHRLLIVGSMDDECKDEFAKAMEDQTVEKRITYVPWVDSWSLPQYYQQMHCLFHPLWADACPNIVAEALACGVPVVVPEYGGPAEFVLPDGGIAIGGERWDYGENFCRRMADAITKVYENWENFSPGARRQAERHLSIEKMTEAYLDLMELPHQINA
jgi:glycosyltransferase involved in cell wall biosynthesis